MRVRELRLKEECQSWVVQSLDIAGFELGGRRRTKELFDCVSMNSMKASARELGATGKDPRINNNRVLIHLTRIRRVWVERSLVEMRF